MNMLSWGCTISFHCIIAPATPIAQRHLLDFRCISKALPQGIMYAEPALRCRKSWGGLVCGRCIHSVQSRGVLHTWAGHWATFTVPSLPG